MINELWGCGRKRSYTTLKLVRSRNLPECIRSATLTVPFFLSLRSSGFHTPSDPPLIQSKLTFASSLAQPLVVYHCAFMMEGAGSFRSQYQTTRTDFNLIVNIIVYKYS